MAREKRERRTTGGRSPPDPVDSMSQKVYDLITAQFEPLENLFDDDKPVISLAASSAVEVVDIDDDASGNCTYKIIYFILAYSNYNSYSNQLGETRYERNTRGMIVTLDFSPNTVSA